MKKSVKSVCPFDCPDCCSLVVEVEAGRVVSVKGDMEHPVTRGLLCPKMLHYESTLYSPDRITTPLIRIGAKGSGSFKAISWDEASDIICSRWQKIIAEHGSEAILPYSYSGTMGMVQRNAGHPFFHKLGASRLERTICSPAKDAGWKLIMGDTPACDPSEILDSDFVVLWGINAAATSIHTMRDANSVKKKGGKLFAIDTYKTATLDAADEYLLLKPGTDGAFALGVMNVIVNSGRADMRFVAENVKGFDQFAKILINEYRPEKVAQICGVSPEDIKKFAEMYISAKAPFIRVGSGLTRYGNGAMTIRTITALPAITGAFDKKGGGIFCGTSTGDAFYMQKITREDLLPFETRVINMNRLGEALNSAESPICSLYVYHSNPASIAPDQNMVIKALLRDDLFTVVHERFMTDTARYADIILPATTSLEQDDIFRSYGNYYAERSFKAIEPLGECRSNWDTFRTVSEKLGFEEPIFKKSATDMIEELIADANDWRSVEESDRLRRGDIIKLTPPEDKNRRWKTASGKIEIENDRDEFRFPAYLPKHSEKDGYPLALQPAVTPFALNSSFYELKELADKQKNMILMMNSFDAKQRDLKDGDKVIAKNSFGAVEFSVEISEKIKVGTVVTEGVWWSSLNGGKAGVNALTSQRLTDRGNGSTLYDVAVEVEKMENATICQ